MGVYHLVCAVSGLPIQGGQTRLFLLTSTAEKVGGPIALPLLGAYDSYGSLEDVEETPATELTVKALRSAAKKRQLVDVEGGKLSFDDVDEFLAELRSATVDEVFLKLDGRNVEYFMVLDDVYRALIESVELDPGLPEHKHARLSAEAPAKLVERAFGAEPFARAAYAEPDRSTVKELIDFVRFRGGFERRGGFWAGDREAAQYGDEEVAEAIERARESLGGVPALAAAVEAYATEFEELREVDQENEREDEADDGADDDAETRPAPAVAPRDPALYVKQVRCGECGAPKVRPSAGAYVYCDYCATLIDWDFQASISDPASKLPGREYTELCQSLAPELARAKQNGDRAAYLALQKRIFDAYVDACPAALSPRIRDPEYRRAFVDYTAETETARDFDPECARVSALQDEAVAKIVWQTSGSGPTAEPQSFFRVLESVKALSAASLGLYEKLGILARQPDGMSAQLGMKIALSAFVQGWLPYLSADVAEKLLADEGLRGDYRAVAPFDAKVLHCGACGSEARAPEGARRTLCADCGHLIDVSHGELPCGGCGAPVALPFGTTLFRCPYCKHELRAQRWLGGTG